MRLRHVPDHHKLGQERLWDRIRAEAVRLLDQRGIWFSSVDLVRFAWIKTKYPICGDEDDTDEDDTDEDDTDEDIADPVADEENPDCDKFPYRGSPYESVYTTPATIWIGVMPNTTTAEQAYHSSRDILDLLVQHNINNVEVAYRESEVTFSAGPALFAPVDDFDPLKAIVDSLSTALSMPIARLGTDTQGALGFCFKVGEDLYAVTARHVLFENYEPNTEYNYVAGPKKEVVVMGPSAFTAHIAFLQDTIRDLDCVVRESSDEVDRVERALADPIKDGGPSRQVLEPKLLQRQGELTRARRKLDAVTAHLADVQAKWRTVEDRVIGHVVWAPPIAAASPHQYMQDACVIKLDKDKFHHFAGNALGLIAHVLYPGRESDIGKFIRMMRDSDFDGPREFKYSPDGLLNVDRDAPREFEYPPDGYLKLHDILTDDEMRTTATDQSIRRVIKRGPSTLTTIGRLSAYASHVRRYYPTGHLDSVETAIHTDHADSLPFSMRGDSGAAIVDARGRFVALLTGGAGINDITYGTPSCEITYGTPMHWLWPRIEARFEGATLEVGDYDLL